ncbi:MAG: type II secretion system protein [Phycisphaerales bacterium]|nr:MAG: type II secretion system protein [Phycisphaerales bacterium]
MSSPSQGRVSGRKAGFTLIELLVVIAIIALLIGILLPALGNARNTARLLVSQSNVRQIMVATENYKADNRDDYPLKAIWPDRNRPWESQLTSGISSWTYGGKFNARRIFNDYWQGYAGGIFDVCPNDRPLNFYLYPDFDVPGPVNGFWGIPGSGARSAQTALRERVELEVYRSPGDQATYQRNTAQQFYNNPVPDFTLRRGSYDDVGTSYHANLRWLEALRDANPSQFGGGNPNFTRGIIEGLRRLKLAANFDTSRFVFMYDQTMDLVANSNNPNLQLMGEFNQVNRAVAGFLDGHVEYLDVIPGEANTDGYRLHFPRRGDR